MISKPSHAGLRVLVLILAGLLASLPGILLALRWVVPFPFLGALAGSIVIVASLAGLLVGWSEAQSKELTPAEVVARIAGLTLLERWGNWDRSPFTSESRKHVSVWEKPAVPVA